MALAFWRRKKTSADARSQRRRAAANAGAGAVDEETGGVDPADVVRVRARRRLIGAAALLLIVAVVVPMLLDPEPKPAADNIAIDIPSERIPFTPRPTLPPVPSPANVPIAPPPDVAPSAEKAGEPPIKAVEAKKSEKIDEQRGRTLLEGKASVKPVVATEKGVRFAVQAAAPASETAARDLAERLKKAGLASYTEKVDTKQGARYRVRLGPYISRDEADSVRNRLKEQGIAANLVTL